jgi:hypothetical protein
MKKYEKVITVYELELDYVVEVIYEEEEIELWIHNKNYGVKSFAIGFLKKDIKSEQDLLEYLKPSFINEFIIMYKNDYEW